MKYVKVKLFCKICGKLAGYSDSEGVSIVGCKNCDFGRREGFD